MKFVLMKTIMYPTKKSSFFLFFICCHNYLPFNKVAEFFAKIGRWLIIEFVPKEDSQVKKLLATREDIFDKYDQENFEKEFKKYFKIESSVAIKGSKRFLYLMKSK